jgi:hypothetical protein
MGNFRRNGERGYSLEPKVVMNPFNDISGRTIEFKGKDNRKTVGPVGLQKAKG